MLDDLGTQGGEPLDPGGDPAGGAPPVGDPAAGGQPLTSQEKYFLDVDERHRYRTADDAKKAVLESGSRISQLTPWEETSRRYGVTDPNHLPKIYDDYLAMRQKIADFERQQSAPPQPVKDQAAAQQLDPKDQQNIRYLEDKGFTRKEAIDKTLSEKLTPLEQRLAAMESFQQQNQTVLSNANIDAGRAVLSTLMTTAGYPIDNPKFNQMVEDSIVAWMEQNSRYDQQGNALPGTPLWNFHQGGHAMKQVVEQGSKAVFDNLNFLRQQQDGQAQQRRSQSAARASRPMPRQGAPVPNGKDQPDPQARRQPGSGSFSKTEMHEKAWELLQERGGGSGN